MPRKKIQTWETEQAPFPSRLSEIMKERKISQETLASAIGVKRQTVSLYKTGQSSPSAEQLRKISKFFSVPSDWLLGLTDDSCMQVRATDVLGVPPKAIDNLQDISQHFPDVLSNLLVCDVFFGFVASIHRLNLGVIRTKQAHEKVKQIGLIEADKCNEMRMALERYIEEILGYPISIVEPCHDLGRLLEDVRMSAEILAKHISGFDSLSIAERLDHIYDFDEQDLKEFYQ